jgi:hypothetical protein
MPLSLNQPFWTSGLWTPRDTWSLIRETLVYFIQSKNYLQTLKNIVRNIDNNNLLYLTMINIFNKLNNDMCGNVLGEKV